MAKGQIHQFLGLNQSIFRGKSRPRRGSSFARPKRISPLFVNPEEAKPLQRINSEFCAFIMTKCAAARIASNATLSKATASLAGRPMAESAAWEWWLEGFLKERPEFLDPIYAEALQMGRSRIRGARKKENMVIAKERIDREMAQVRAQYAEERKANGGEADFFDSNKWQRLRYEVLVESKGCCTLCGRSAREHGVVLEVDHIKPRSRFPNLSLVKSNLQVLCFDCNRGKGNRDTTDWRQTPANDSSKGEAA